MWAVSATVSVKEQSGSTWAIQIPTFYLDENVQGIVSESQVEKIAHSIINPLKADMEIHLTICKV